MFGTFRYLLATLVFISHLFPSLVYNMGSYAVFGFYTLSGFLMALVLTEVYGFSTKGTSKFLLNRALRLYPPYLAVFFLSLITYYIIFPVPPQFAHIFEIPSNLLEWFKNIAMFELIPGQTPMLVAVAWSLYVELFFYLVMALFLARNKYITIVWFIFSVLLTTYMVVKGYSFDERYYTFSGATLPFSTGALIYFYKSKLKYSAKYLLTIGIGLYILNLIITRIYGSEYMIVYGLYASYVISVLIIIGLINLNTKNVQPRLLRIDKFLGDLSYPIYLSHWPIAIFISGVFFAGNLQVGISLLLYSFIPINIVSLLIYYFIDKRIDFIRVKVKRIES